jgi:hypothetical protein
MKYTVEMASGAMMYAATFMKIRSGVRKLWEGIHMQTHRQESELKMRVSQLMEKFAAIYGTRRSIAVLRWSYHIQNYKREIYYCYYAISGSILTICRALRLSSKVSYEVSHERSSSLLFQCIVFILWGLISWRGYVKCSILLGETIYCWLFVPVRHGRWRQTSTSTHHSITGKECRRK